MLITSSMMLAAYMKDRRQTQKLTQQQASENIGLRQATISEFEKDPTNAQISTLLKLISALDLELHLKPKPQKTIHEASSQFFEEEEEKW